MNKLWLFVCWSAVSCVLAVQAAPAETLKETELKPVVVSATRFPGAAADTPASIRIITRDEIEASGANHLAEVLTGRGGIQLTDLFGDGSRTTLSMRGFGGNAAANSLVLVDGRRLNNSDLGAPDLNSVDLKDVERIEITRGSAGVLFGDQAVGGVVHIITRQATKFAVDLNAEAGSYDGRQTRFALADRSPAGLSYRLSGAYRETDNYRDNNRQEYGNAFGRLSQDFSRGSLFADYQRTREQLRLPGALFDDEVAADRQQTNNPNDFLDTDTDVGRIGGEFDFSERWVLIAEITHRQAQTDGLLTVGGFASTLGTEQRHRSFNPRIQGRIPVVHGDLLLTLGSDLEWTRFELASAAFGVTDDEQRVRNFYLQGVLPLSASLSLTLGARHARVEDDLRDPFTFPGGVALQDQATVGEAGLSYAVAKDWRLFLRAGENYRFPKADENSFTPFGVVGLKTQTGRSWETGMEWRAGNRHAGLVLYQMELEDEIDFDPILFANNNLDDTRRRGVILDGGVELNRYARWFAEYSLVDAEFTAGPEQGEDLPFVARQSLKSGLELRWRNWRSLLEMQSIARRRAIGDYGGDFPQLSGYTVWNLLFAYGQERWSLDLRINNLTDKAYRSQAATAFRPITFVQDTAYFPAPERNLRFNLTYHFD